MSHLLDILLRKFSLHPRVGHLPRQRPHTHLFHEPQGRDRAFPVRDVLRLDLDQRHARVLRGAGVHAVPQIAEPGAQARVVDLLDAGVLVGDGGGGAADADPVVGAGVLEGDLDRLFVLEVGELLRVLVGDEEKVRAVPLADGHAARDGAQTGPHGGQEANAELVDGFVEVVDLLRLGSVVVILLGDGGVGLAVDFGLLEGFRHGGSGAICEYIGLR